ncbi:MAG TPA: 1-acyl-sn-glycerol-3-phosphate acyltransferase [Candidatus Acidoferrales bacterium]|nr:1-acyl-sn-glycerol-3-phosphate acyltransferase [Candidatus Acidoferrales bacterium]
MGLPVPQPESNDLLSEPGPLRRLGFLPAFICRRFLSHVRMDPGAIEHLHGLAAKGSIVYVMRYRSLVDYMLVAYVLLREGLPLPEFVSDIPSLLLRPLREILVTLRERLRQQRAMRGAARHFQDRDRCQRLVTEGKPTLIFMRSRAPGLHLFGSRRVALQRVRSGTDYLREIVHAGLSSGQEVFLVPLAVLRGRGYRRKESRLATLVYSVQEAPGDVKRLVSLLWNARETSITVGKHVQLSELVNEHRDEGEERIVRRLARALQIFLHREEKVVWGPTLLPKQRVRQMVLRTEEMSQLISRLAREQNQPEEKSWKAAERYFDEMAANFQGSYFTLLEVAFNRIWPRIFQGFDYRGLDEVIECVKQHPVVLVPCHRSHFDYVILSYLFHLNYLSPPHIAAGINLSFWPLGPLFRGAGAYFIRRTFEDNELYKGVFRSYLAFLIREGYTQEFFIEGGRSRTGKILTPKMGILSAIVNAYIGGARSDLYFVPVSIQYGRVVEEESYTRELVGAEKEKESLLSLLRARTVLRQKRGTVYVTFASPISLREVLGDRKQLFRDSADNPPVEDQKRRFIQKLGFRILRDVNAVTVAGATSVSATVLLSSPNAAWRYADFLPAAQSLLHFLRHDKVALTASLERNASDFLENLAFLENGGLVKRLPNDGVVIHVPPEKRMALDFYKNNTIHFFLLPALLSRGLLRNLRGAALRDDVHWWLDFYRWEFPLPEREEISAELGRLLDYYRDIGAVAQGDVVQADHPFVRTTSGLLDNFCEAYWETARTLSQLDGSAVSLKVFLETARKRYDTGLLLGEVRRPEGRSTVTLENAVNRYCEMGLANLDRKAKGKERLLRLGPQVDALAATMERLSQNLAEHR